MSRAQAATIIQKYTRGYLARLYYRQLKLDRRFQEQEELFYQESALLTIKKSSFMDLSIHNRSQSTFTIPMGYKHQIAALSIQKYLRGYLARGAVKGQFRQSTRYKRASKQSVVNNPFTVKDPSKPSDQFEILQKIKVSKRLYQKALISMKDMNTPPANTYQSYLESKNPLKAKDPFKTDFSHSIFDTSRKLQRQQEQQRPQSVLYKSSSYLPTEASMLSAKQMLQFSPKSQILKQPVLYEFDLYLRAAKEIQRIFRGWIARKLYCMMRNSAILIQIKFRSY